MSLYKRGDRLNQRLSRRKRTKQLQSDLQRLLGRKILYSQKDVETGWDLSSGDREAALLFVYLEITAKLDIFQRRLRDRGSSIDALAWAARSLLELEIIAEYTNKPENAQQFMQDALRDILELNTGYDREFLGTDYALSLDKAKTFLTGNRKGPLYISSIAEKIGKKEYLQERARWLSKFVHPTPLSLLFVSSRSDGRMRRLFANEGKDHFNRASAILSAGYCETYITNLDHLLKSERVSSP